MEFEDELQVMLCFNQIGDSFITSHHWNLPGQGFARKTFFFVIFIHVN
jgi:hypothetical protein